MMESMACSSDWSDSAFERVSLRCTMCVEVVSRDVVVSGREHDEHVQRQMLVIMSTTKVRHPMQESLTLVRYCFFILYPNIVV